MWTASEYFKQQPPHSTAYNTLHRYYMWEWNYSKPKGTRVNLTV